MTRDGIFAAQQENNFGQIHNSIYKKLLNREYIAKKPQNTKRKENTNEQLKINYNRNI